MQKIGYIGRKINIPTISMLFVENIYLLPENVSTFKGTIISKNDEILIKTSYFQDKTVPIILENKAEVDSILATLYNVNMQICKKKGLDIYQKVDPSLFWYMNTIQC